MAKYGKKSQSKVKRAMHELKEGKLRSGRSGKKVTSRKQAIAIGLSEARASGGKVPKKASAKGGRPAKKTTKRPAKKARKRMGRPAKKAATKGRATKTSRKTARKSSR
jgi:hypothetical protein